MAEESNETRLDVSTDETNFKPKNKRNRKDKPWDSENIDHWKIDPVTKENPLDAPVEESSFATLFPKYREAYIREVWPSITTKLKEYGIKCELNLMEGSMTVKTTRKTWDPYVILKARDLIRLLSRSIPAPQALKILQDGEIGRAVQQECRDRSRMPSSA
eukprot:TRINITY_DN18033_c0_g1_i9.p1 TRINITY_DN18033_c0_g1~~TRINITY_DN18033_c0_g1_i9.p1  ORF type:complete len:160 (-),score=17.34 TRINITY_DN18033_c0_g1_i9:11-490(-)